MRVNSRPTVAGAGYDHFRHEEGLREMDPPERLGLVLCVGARPVVPFRLRVPIHRVTRVRVSCHRRLLGRPTERKVPLP